MPRGRRGILVSEDDPETAEQRIEVGIATIVKREKIASIVEREKGGGICHFRNSEKCHGRPEQGVASGALEISLS